MLDALYGTDPGPRRHARPCGVRVFAPPRALHRSAGVAAATFLQDEGSFPVLYARRRPRHGTCDEGGREEDEQQAVEAPSSLSPDARSTTARARRTRLPGECEETRAPSQTLGMAPSRTLPVSPTVKSPNRM